MVFTLPPHPFFGTGTGVITVLFLQVLSFLISHDDRSDFQIRDSQIVPDIHPPYWLPLFFIGLFIAVVKTISPACIQLPCPWRGKMLIF